MDEPAPRRTRTWWETYGTDSPVGLIVAGALIITVLLALAVRFLFPGSHRSFRPQTTCANHLRQFGGIFTSESMEQGYPDGGGVPLLISYRRKGFIQRGREEIFTCPQDPDAHEPANATESALYDTVDLTDAEALAPLCSYAVRDFARFPITVDERDAKADKPIWIACDRQGLDGRTPHHPGGLNVLFDDGAVVFMDGERLGFAFDDPIIVGPDSPHPELRKMAFVPAPRTDPHDGGEDR